MRAERRRRVARVRLVVNRSAREEPGERTKVAGQTVSDRQDDGLQAVAKWRGERVGCAAGRVFGFVYAVSFQPSAAAAAWRDSASSSVVRVRRRRALSNQGW